MAAPEDLAADLSKMTLAAGVPSEDVMANLKSYRQKHTELETSQLKEINAVKLRYYEKFEEIYDQRHLALTDGWKQFDTGTPKVPNFWLIALQHYSIINGMIELHDEPILKYLADIRFSWIDENEQTGFRVDFHFVENPYFTNVLLSKTYEMERDEEGDCVLVRTIGTTINWTEGKDVTKKIVTRKQKHKKTNKTRTFQDEVESDSFFNLFKSNDVPPPHKLEEMRGEDVDALELLVEAELEIGCGLRDKIIPHAEGWYLGLERDSDEETESNDSEDEESSFEE
eukprot:GHVP01059383.1.p1 GENE.GHVP01059383.1~~GHVP01059383.1.p1  ORF type:complete len:292 (+),score=65.11 GHVP01059383.1:26-877(+)